MSVAYQERDREIVDYNLYPLEGTPFMLRGPKPVLKPNEYFACVGDGHTFGCFCEEPYATLLGRRLKLEVLNLGIAGAGPQLFLEHPPLLEKINQARFAIIQIMSARSEDDSLSFSCSGDPAGVAPRQNGPNAEPGLAQAEAFTTPGKEFAGTPVAQIRDDWIASFNALLQEIHVPAVLLWFSERTPSSMEKKSDVQKRLNEYPQLVTAQMVDVLRRRLIPYVECVTCKGSPQPLVSRFNGKPTPIVEPHPAGSNPQRCNNYYPSPMMHLDAASALEPICIMLSRGQSPPTRPAPAAPRPRGTLPGISGPAGTGSPKITQAAPLRHTFPAVATLLLCVAVLFIAEGWACHLEDRSVDAVAPDMFDQKQQGIVLQQAAFRQKDLLPIYGSSELMVANRYHANTLFSNYPTGFTIFPVGKAGMTSLTILEDIAAVGPVIRGKKLAISLSPTWFFERKQVDPESYAGNFSRMHAEELLCSESLTYDIKRDAAKRMLDYPDTIAGDPILAFAMKKLAAGSFLDRCLFDLVLPANGLERMILRFQDHWETVAYIGTPLDSHHSLAAPCDQTALAWKALADHASIEFRAQSNNNPFGFHNDEWLQNYREKATQGKNTRSDAQFKQELDAAVEWHDFDLLLRVLKELGARPLILSMPIKGAYYENLGVPAAARDAYYTKLAAVCKQYGAPLIDFSDHDNDNDFLFDLAHLSEKGWVYYDEALNAFYQESSDAPSAAIQR